MSILAGVSTALLRRLHVFLTACCHYFQKDIFRQIRRSHFRKLSVGEDKYGSDETWIWTVRLGGVHPVIPDGKMGTKTPGYGVHRNLDGMSTRDLQRKSLRDCACGRTVSNLSV